MKNKKIVEQQEKQEKKDLKFGVISTGNLNLGGNILEANKMHYIDEKTYLELKESILYKKGVISLIEI